MRYMYVTQAARSSAAMAMEATAATATMEAAATMADMATAATATATATAAEEGHFHQCPADWKTPGNAGGLHKLARQTSEAAYQSSGGACRPAGDGPFPHSDCQVQCRIGGHSRLLVQKESAKTKKLSLKTKSEKSEKK
eukprot:g23271.t1